MTDPTDTVTLPLPLTGVEPYYLRLLRQAVRESSVTKTATRLLKPAASLSKTGGSYSRPYVSLVITGKIPAHKVAMHFQGAVLAAFGDGRIDCPHLKRDIAPGECQRYAALTWGQVANTGYERLDHWRACDKCLQNPANQKATP